MEKKKRATNLQMQEKELLVDLVVKYSDTIENKSTDVASVRTKTDAWKRLAEEFNGTTPSAIPREWQQLKHVCISSQYRNFTCDECIVISVFIVNCEVFIVILINVIDADCYYTLASVLVCSPPSEL